MDDTESMPKHGLRRSFAAFIEWLAIRHDIPDIAGGRLARDVSLANRVRSGRKQP